MHSERIQARRDRRSGALMFLAVCLVFVLCVVTWPPTWLAVLVLLLSPAAGAALAVGWDHREDQRT